MYFCPFKKKKKKKHEIGLHPQVRHLQCYTNGIRQQCQLNFMAHSAKCWQQGIASHTPSYGLFSYVTITNVTVKEVHLVYLLNRVFKKALLIGLLT